MESFVNKITVYRIFLDSEDCQTSFCLKLSLWEMSKTRSFLDEENVDYIDMEDRHIYIFIHTQLQNGTFEIP